MMTKQLSNRELELRVKYLEKKLGYLVAGSEQSSFWSMDHRFRILAEAAHEGIFILEDGYCVEANLSGCDMFGYTYEEIIGRSAASVFISEHRDLVREKIVSGDSGVYEAIGLRKDGSVFHAEVRGRNFDYEGRDYRVSTVTDITFRRNAEQKLIESENKYRSVVENAADGLLIGDGEGKIIDVNGSFLKMTGYKADDLLFSHISKLFDPEELKERPLRFDLLDLGESVIIQREIIDKSGVPIPIEMNSKRTSKDNYLAVVRDLRERIKAEENLRSVNRQLKEAKNKAEESDRLKSAFLANMSHEIRTPMNGVLGFAELLKSTELNSATREAYLDIIIQSGQQLLCIINDVLAISKIETGQMPVQFSRVDLLSIFEEIRLFFVPVANERNNKLSFSVCDEQICHSFECDETKIRQVLINLINNGLKFTQNGHVKFGVYREKEWMHFYVEDNGIGISANNLERIFYRFVQVSRGYNNNPKGTGLGLPISQKLVEMMGGMMHVDSEPAKGSVFHFLLPLR
ncbi:PAS domain S-box protein [Marinilabilia sp.]|uniref:PAS domain S-box protein n=1 Tax=Marinilabilia sp. TaxID=2021252 RepID=UPI0025C3D7B5|nr:PAS domain S-box protein [Marinilabilia sp.]